MYAPTGIFSRFESGTCTTEHAALEISGARVRLIYIYVDPIHARRIYTSHTEGLSYIMYYEMQFS